MHRRFLLLLALLVSSAFPLHAQTVDEILARHDAAIGLEQLRKLQTVRITGRAMVGPGMEAPLTILRKRPNQLRMEFSVQGMTGVRAFDGQHGWSLMPFMGQSEPVRMSPEEERDLAEQADFDGPLVDWQAKGSAIEFAGRDTVDGAAADRLKVTAKSGRVSEFDLDAETGLVLRERGKRLMRGSEIDGESVFSDFHDVAGMLLPFVSEQGMKGSPQKRRTTYERYEWGVPLSDSLFALPAGLVADTTKAAARRGPRREGKPPGGER